VTRLVVTRDAEKDLSTILTFLKEQANAIVAEEFGRDLRRTLLRLLQFPDSGALRPELGPNVRIAIVYPYLLPYEHVARQAELTLLRILHGKSNITAEILMRR
jgi:plasmid stabilization system protein ParE